MVIEETGKTEVTSIAKEMEKTGKEIKVPSVEELVKRASISYIQNIKLLNDLVTGKSGSEYRISRKGMSRVLTAILQLPEEDLDVTLKDDAEKGAFILGQRVLADRFILTQHHINEEMQRLKKEKEEKEKK